MTSMEYYQPMADRKPLGHTGPPGPQTLSVISSSTASPARDAQNMYMSPTGYRTPGTPNSAGSTPPQAGPIDQWHSQGPQTPSQMQSIHIHHHHNSHYEISQHHHSHHLLYSQYYENGHQNWSSSGMDSTGGSIYGGTDSMYSMTPQSTGSPPGPVLPDSSPIVSSATAHYGLPPTPTPISGPPTSNRRHSKKSASSSSSEIALPESSSGYIPPSSSSSSKPRSGRKG